MSSHYSALMKENSELRASDGSIAPRAHSSAVERSFHMREVPGSNPGAPTTPQPRVVRYRGAYYVSFYDESRQRRRVSLGTNDKAAAFEAFQKWRRGELFRPEPGQAKVYLIRCRHTKRVKIGIAAAPFKRHQTLQQASPTELDLICSCPGGLKYEQSLHERYAAERLHGEWFALSDAQFKDLKAEMVDIKLGRTWGHLTGRSL